MMSLPQSYKQAVFTAQGSPLTIEQASLKLPSEGEILVKVEACGVCYSASFAQNNAQGGGFPLVPGHEIIGRVAAVGDGVSRWKVGDRIGAGWHGGHDGKWECSRLCDLTILLVCLCFLSQLIASQHKGTCKACKQGFHQMCDNQVINGQTKHGGCKFAFISHCLMFQSTAVNMCARSLAEQMLNTPYFGARRRRKSQRTWTRPSTHQSCARA